jgi:hypothetical protein
MKNSLLVLLLGLHFYSLTQFNIKWSELVPAKGRVYNIYPISYSDFYTTRFHGSALFGSLHISIHSNFDVKSSGRILSKVPNGIGTVESISVLKGVPVVFLSDRKDGENILYAQKYGTNCEPKGNPVELNSFTMPKSWKRKGEYGIFISKNNEFICINYEIPGTKDERTRYGFKIFDEDFEEINKGEYELPFATNLVKISNAYLSDKGDFFFATKIYKEDEDKRSFRTQYALEKVLVYQAKPTGLDEFEFNFKNGKSLSNFSFSSDENKILSFTGLYGDRRTNGIKGVFYFQLDFLKKQIISEGWNEFGKDFITENWTERDKRKADKREASGKGEAQLFEYDVRDIMTLKDGSLIGILEQYYVRVITNTDPRTGTPTTTYYYYYNDVIVYKINPNSTFAWLKKINKYQLSTNDNGYFSSIAYFVNKDKINILFNDNLKNYDAEGNFITNSEQIYPTSYRKKTNTVALVEINIMDGNFSRKTMFNREETKAYAVPKKFSVDYKKNEMLMLLLYGRKEKYGILSFE